MRIRPLTALPLALFAAFGIAGAAAASTTQQSLMQDDDLVLYRGPDVQVSTLQRMAGLGVDTVRINLIWRNVVGKGGRKAQRKPTNPASYPAANWDPYGKLDRLPVAVVNEDTPTAYGKTAVHAGDDFVQNLHDQHTFDER